MIRLTLEGLPGFNGVFDLDLEKSPLTNRELHWIKTIAGVRLGEFEASADAGDNDLLVAFSIIALVRSGKIQKDHVNAVVDVLWDAEGGKILAEEVTEKDGDVDPPALREPNSGNISEGNQQSSSGDSNGTGDGSPETNPVSIGVPS